MRTALKLLVLAMMMGPFALATRAGNSGELVWSPRRADGSRQQPAQMPPNRTPARVTSAESDLSFPEEPAEPVVARRTTTARSTTQQTAGTTAGRRSPRVVRDPNVQPASAMSAARVSRKSRTMRQLPMDDTVYMDEGPMIMSAGSHEQGGPLRRMARRRSMGTYQVQDPAEVIGSPMEDIGPGHVVGGYAQSGCADCGSGGGFSDGGYVDGGCGCGDGAACGGGCGDSCGCGGGYCEDGGCGSCGDYGCGDGGSCGGGGCGCGGCGGCGGGGFGPFAACDWWFFKHLSLYSGTHGFKSPVDLGSVGNFGFHQGVNWGVPLFPRLGFGAQFGFGYHSSNYSGIFLPNNNILDTSRNQYFVTAGLFRRAIGCSRLQYGAAFDYLADNYYIDANLTQLRGEIAYVGCRGNSIGFAMAGSTRNNTGLLQNVRLLNNQRQEWSALDRYTVFYDHFFNECARGRVFAGVDTHGNGLLGNSLHVALNDKFALESSFIYVSPGGGPAALNVPRDTWGININLVWYPGRTARQCFSDAFRPMFDVANNSNFVVDHLNP